MAKQLISKTYDAASDTWTEVYRLKKPVRQHVAPPVENIEWPADRDVWSAKELVCQYLGVRDVTASDLLVHIKEWRKVGIIYPLCGGRLIKVGGKPSRYYAVRNAERYTTAIQIRKALRAGGSTPGSIGSIPK